MSQLMLDDSLQEKRALTEPLKEPRAAPAWFPDCRHRRISQPLRESNWISLSGWYFLVRFLTCTSKNKPLTSQQLSHNTQRQCICCHSLSCLCSVVFTTWEDTFLAASRFLCRASTWYQTHASYQLRQQGLILPPELPKLPGTGLQRSTAGFL